MVLFLWMDLIIKRHERSARPATVATPSAMVD
jgi:hypothetical protein